MESLPSVCEASPSGLGHLLLYLLLWSRNYGSSVSHSSSVSVCMCMCLPARSLDSEASVWLLSISSVRIKPKPSFLPDKCSYQLGHLTNPLGYFYTVK